MSDNESEYDKYVKDSRIACKYGAKCYQKNPVHHQKYKHPPNKNKQRTGHVNKKIKIENNDKETKDVITSNDVSDSDDSNSEENSDTSSNKNVKLTNQVVSDSESKESDDDTSAKKEEDGVNNDERESSIKKEIHTNNDVSKSDDSNDDKSIDRTDAQLNKNEGKPNTSKIDYKQFIKEKFLVHIPEDFYQFWEYCKRLKPNNPLDALKDIGLKLVGPFDVLAGRFDNVNKSDEEYLLHWRFYRDTPELQTVLKANDNTGYHIGYFRDSPDEPPVFLVNNSSKKNGVFYQMGPNIFAAVNAYLEDLKKSGDPFKKMHIGRIQASIKKEAQELKLDLSQKTDSVISREKKIVTRTFNKIGLVVPYDRKTQVGYRELAFNNKDLSTLLTKLEKSLPEQRTKYLSELQPVFTYASIATDECDFGTGIELGWNIISHGVDCLDSTALRFLVTNYRLLNREAFAKIAEAHMKNRKKGCDLSII